VPLALPYGHPWDVSEDQARCIQSSLAGLISEKPLDRPVHRVGGIDVSYHEAMQARAVVVVLSFPELRTIETAMAALPVCFPYLPGLLGFREIPVMEEALKKLHALPDVLLCDGHGRAHPKRFGMASHLGLLLDLTTIGCAKSPPAGSAIAPSPDRGSLTCLWDDGEIIGLALRTQPKAKPVHISVGQRIDRPSADSLVLACAGMYRLPEPLRLAHLLASERPLTEGKGSS